jgi:spore germination cell wall hydrolase CwlJ-like protein
VAQVVLNRVRNPDLSEFDLRRRLPERRLEEPLPVLLRLRRHQGPDHSARRTTAAQEIAMAVTAGKIFICRSRLVDALLCATMSARGWARTMKKMTKIGLHIFYRTYGGGWS